MLKLKDAEKYPTHTKPAKVNAYATAPRSRAPAQNTHGAPPLPSQFLGGPPGFPYSYYPPPFMSPMWYAQLQPGAPNPVFLPTNPMPSTLGSSVPALKQATKVEYPRLGAWLNYCDQHPEHCGEDFSRHLEMFNVEGYRFIHQLTGPHTSVEKLSAWLNIGCRRSRTYSFRSRRPLLLMLEPSDGCSHSCWATKNRLFNFAPFELGKVTNT